MTPEQIEAKLNELTDFMNSLKESSAIPLEVDQAFRDRLIIAPVSLPTGFEDAPLGSIAAPTGGTTVDPESRTAINLIITRLEDLGLVNDN